MSQTSDLSKELAPLLNWLSNHFNLQRFFLLLSLVLFLIAWNRGIALLYGMMSLILAILAVSYLMPHLQLRNIKASLPKSQECHCPLLRNRLVVRAGNFLESIV